MIRHIGEAFFGPRRLVEIAQLGVGSEAIVLRSVFESLGIDVLLHSPGTPGDVLKILDRPDGPTGLLILCGHGTENGLYIGEFGEGLGIDTSMLVNGCLPASALAGNVRLPDWAVISTACLSGRPEMAAAFVEGGASTYIAHDDYPNGTTAVMFVIHLLYGLQIGKLTLEDAWRKAAEYEDDARSYVFHTPHGSYRV